MPLLTAADLTPFATIDSAKADAMVADAVALALIHAPCLSSDSLTAEQQAAAKAVLRAAVLRWNDAGTGVVSSQTAGPYAMAVDTRQQRRTMFWPSEIAALQKICVDPTDGGVFSVDTAASPMTFHSVLYGHEDGAADMGAIAFDNDYDDDWPFF